MFKSGTDLRGQEPEECRKQCRDHGKEQRQEDPQRINRCGWTGKISVPGHQGKRNAQVPGQTFDIHIQKFTRRDRFCLKRQRHQHVVFLKAEQIAVRSEKRENKSQCADQERAHHRRGTDQPGLSESDADQDAVCHQHDIQEPHSDRIPHDPAPLLFIPGVFVYVPLARGQQKRPEEQERLIFHCQPPGTPLPGNAPPSFPPSFRLR